MLPPPPPPPPPKTTLAPLPAKAMAPNAAEADAMTCQPHEEPAREEAQMWPVEQYSTTQTPPSSAEAKAKAVAEAIEAAMEQQAASDALLQQAASDATRQESAADGPADGTRLRQGKPQSLSEGMSRAVRRDRLSARRAVPVDRLSRRLAETPEVEAAVPVALGAEAIDMAEGPLASHEVSRRVSGRSVDERVAGSEVEPLLERIVAAAGAPAGVSAPMPPAAARVTMVEMPEEAILAAAPSVVPLLAPSARVVQAAGSSSRKALPSSTTRANAGATSTTAAEEAVEKASRAQAAQTAPSSAPVGAPAADLATREPGMAWLLQRMQDLSSDDEVSPYTDRHSHPTPTWESPEFESEAIPVGASAAVSTPPRALRGRSSPAQPSKTIAPTRRSTGRRIAADMNDVGREPWSEPWF